MTTKTATLRLVGCFSFSLSVCLNPTRYSSEGRVTNITLPTGEVSGFHGNLERWSRVEVEASTRENFITSTNLSASDTIYMFRQGWSAAQLCNPGAAVVSRQRRGGRTEKHSDS